MAADTLDTLTHDWIAEMELTLSNAFTPAAASALKPAEQTLVAQPLAQDAVQALRNTPAAIYHPSEEAKALGAASQGGEVIEVTSTWVGRAQSPDFAKISARLQGSLESLRGAFESFRASLAETFPSLAEKKFGFTVEANGDLKVLNSASDLSAADMKRLTLLLNDASALKAQAIDYRNVAIDLVDADAPTGGSSMGAMSLTEDNFAKTIDLGAIVWPKEDKTLKERYDSSFFIQLMSKGERATAATEAAMLARRAAQQIT